MKCNGHAIRALSFLALRNDNGFGEMKGAFESVRYFGNTCFDNNNALNGLPVI